MSIRTPASFRWLQLLSFLVICVLCTEARVIQMFDRVTHVTKRSAYRSPE
jgi:hypothetical protein